MTETTRQPLTKDGWITAGIWALGIGLQFATPLLRDRVDLSDDLFIGSFMAPWWVFTQVVLLAGVLWLARNAATKWTTSGRVGFAIAAAIVCALPEPNLITQVLERGIPIADNPVRLALIWSTPLAFYVVPAALVVYAWLTRRPGLSMARALGLGLVVIGVMTFVYILWLTHLWDTYIRTQGGGTVRSTP